MGIEEIVPQDYGGDSGVVELIIYQHKHRRVFGR